MTANRLSKVSVDGCVGPAEGVLWPLIRNQKLWIPQMVWLPLYWLLRNEKSFRARTTWVWASQTAGNPFRLLSLFGWFALCICHVWCGQLLAALHCAWWIDDTVRPLLEIYLPGIDGTRVHLVTTRTTDRKIAAVTHRHKIHVSRNVSPDHELNSEASFIQDWKIWKADLFYPIVGILAEHRLEADLPTYQRCLGSKPFSTVLWFLWSVHNIHQHSTTLNCWQYPAIFQWRCRIYSGQMQQQDIRSCKKSRCVEHWELKCEVKQWSPVSTQMWSIWSIT
jgi:hypothetical protein